MSWVFAVLVGSVWWLAFLTLYSCLVAAGRADRRLDIYAEDVLGQKDALPSAVDHQPENQSSRPDVGHDVPECFSTPSQKILEVPVHFPVLSAGFQPQVEVRAATPPKSFCSTRLKHRLPV